MRRFPTTRRATQYLLLFARFPEEGVVKTRLAAEIGAAAAASLYRAMLLDLLDEIAGGDSGIEVEVLWTSKETPSGADLLQTFGERHLCMQTGKDLGERLTVAFSERIVFHGAEKLIAIGADEPMLTRADVERAFRILDGCDWVMGPAEDGGYWMIGCRSDSFHPSIFEKIDWGTSTVFRETEASIRALGETLALFPCRYDVDRIEDLRRLKSDPPPRAERLRQFLAEWEER